MSARESRVFSGSDLSDAPAARGAARCGWRFPQPIRRFAERLLTQQFWCWGRDIHFAEGNLLLEAGFVRSRSRAEATSCYRWDSTTRHIMLWGFGMFFGERRLGGLYLDRFRFSPHWAPIESLASGIFAPADLPPFGRPCGERAWRLAHRVLDRLLTWLADYERWVLLRAGHAYRAACVRDWLRPTVASGAMRSAWRGLRQRLWERAPERWERLRAKGRYRESA